MTLWSRELDGLRARLVDLLRAGDNLATLLEQSRPGTPASATATPLEIRDAVRAWDDTARAAGTAMSEQLPPFDPDDLEPVEPDHDQEQQDEAERALEQPEQEPELAAAPAPQFSYNDRLYALALTRSGKSEILNVLFSGVQCQRLLLDPKPEFFIPGLDPVHTPDGIDWNQPIIHYRPMPGSDCSQYEQIFADAWTRNSLLVCVHELAALVDYQPNRAGRYLVSYCAQGGAKGKGLLAGTTRPKLVPTAAIAEATHIVVLPPQLARRDDMQAAAEALSPVQGQSFSGDDLATEMARLPRFGFLWKDRRQEGTPLHAFPPLPPEIRRLSIVHRSDDAPN